jgi:hypothetical protein
MRFSTFAIAIAAAAFLVGGCKFRIQRDANVPMHQLLPYPKAPR